MPALGIINNVRAGRVRARDRQVRELLRRTGARCVDVEDLPSIRDGVAELVRAGVEVLAVNGGDGTAQAVVTVLGDQSPHGPDLAFLPGGTTNLTAADLNGRVPLARALRSLTHQVRLPTGQRRYRERPLLRVILPGGDTQDGFFLGAGAILLGMRHFREHVGARGLRDELAAGVSLLRGLAGVASGEHAWSEHHTEVEVPGHEALEGRQNLVMATTLERLLLGLRPWWGKPGPGMHLTVLAHRPRAFLRVIPRVLRGRAHPLATPANGYASADVAGFRLRAQEGFALDGEIFELAEDESVRISGTAPRPFLSLATSSA